jgi:hypothetical protein
LSLAQPPPLVINFDGTKPFDLETISVPTSRPCSFNGGLAASFAHKQLYFGATCLTTIASNPENVRGLFVLEMNWTDGTWGSFEFLYPPDGFRAPNDGVVGADMLRYRDGCLIANARDDNIVYNNGGSIMFWKHNGASWEFIRRAGDPSNQSTSFGSGGSIGPQCRYFLGSSIYSSPSMVEGGTAVVFDGIFENPQLPLMTSPQDQKLYPKSGFTPTTRFGSRSFFPQSDVVSMGPGFGGNAGVFNFHLGATFWNQTDHFIGNMSPGAGFGFAMDYSPSLGIALIGDSHYPNETFIGRVLSYSFVPAAVGTLNSYWTLTQVLTLPNGAMYNQFGYGAILMNGNLALICSINQFHYWYYNTTSLRWWHHASVNLTFNVPSLLITTPRSFVNYIITRFTVIS